jgi:hypothetical protein
VVGDAPDQHGATGAALVEQVGEQRLHPADVVAGDAGLARLHHPDVDHGGVDGREQHLESACSAAFRELSSMMPGGLQLCRRAHEQRRARSAVQGAVAVHDGGVPCCASVWRTDASTQVWYSSMAVTMATTGRARSLAISLTPSSFCSSRMAALPQNIGRCAAHCSRRLRGRDGRRRRVPRGARRPDPPDLPALPYSVLTAWSTSMLAARRAGRTPARTPARAATTTATAS